MNPLIRRTAGAGISFTESLVRPNSLHRAKASHRFLIPQFQSALGTVVHATSLVEALAAALPEAEIVVAGAAFAEQIYAGNPHVSQFIRVPSPLTDLKAAVRTIRAQRLFGGEPYTTLLTTGNERTRITLWAALAGPSRRVGFAVAPELLHEHLRWQPEGSQISNNLRLLPLLGLPAEAMVEPRIHVSQEAADEAEKRLIGLGSSAGRRRIALVTQTSPTQRKQWRAERFLALARHLRDQEQADLIFVGTEKEAPGIDALREQLEFPTISVAGKTGIHELAAIFTRCDAGVTLDTGPLHVGRAVGLPMVVIAPAWSPAHEWLPVGNPHFRIFKNADMLPPAPEDYIIDEVSVDEVIDATNALLTNDASADRNRRQAVKMHA